MVGALRPVPPVPALVREAAPQVRRQLHHHLHLNHPWICD
jgi:hypothetical protein